MKNRKAFLSAATLALLVFVSGCSAPEKDMLAKIEPLTSPAGEYSGQPNLSSGAGGTTYLTWIETGSGPAALKFSMRSSGGWSAPKTIVQNDSLLVNWADFPSLFEMSGDMLAAHWLTTIEGAEEGYNVSLALSKDKGMTWGEPITPHRDGTMTEHGFVSLAPSNGAISVLWLDSRKLEKNTDEVALMETSVAVDGKLGDEREVDPRVCECCQPSIIPVPGGLFAVYRDRSADEIRDIVYSKFDGKEWSKPKTVADDKWQVYACPIQGPAVAAAGQNMAIAWFTAANDKPKVQVALSKDGGATFGAPVQLDKGNPVGRVDVVALEGGGAVVTWIEHVGKDGEVLAAQVGADGQKKEPHTIGKTSVGNASGFPKAERSGDSIIFAWTDTENTRVSTSIAHP